MSPRDRAERDALAEKLRSPGTAVLYIPAMVVGEVSRVFAPGEFKDANEKPIDAPVVLLSTGDAFLVATDTIVPVTGGDLAYYAELTTQLSAALAGAVTKAGAGVDLPTLVRLTRAALVMQKRALDARSEQPG